MSSSVLPVPEVAAPRPSRLKARIRALQVNGFMLAIHLACLGVFFVTPTATALILCAVTYSVRVFALTGGFHRYFSHRAYKTSRPMAFLIGATGCSAMQTGPLDWASRHREHHKYSDQPEDPHSPVARSVWWAHLGWILSWGKGDPDMTLIRDFACHPEIRWLNKLHYIPGFLLAGLCYLIDGWSGLVWGFIVSTVLVYHATWLVNSVCHVFGRKRYHTTDESRNNAVVALLTFGEGWHNNHHCYQSSANQGFYWYELDISYTVLRTMNVFGLVWDLRKPPLEKLPLIGREAPSERAVPTS